MGQLVNGSLRLCVIALFEKDVAHAQSVLRQQESLRFYELMSSESHTHIDRWSGAQGDFERSVIRSLGEVAKQAHEIADAILFWLEGKTYASDRHNSLELPTARHQGATNLYYMQSKKTESPKTAQCLPC
jgi:hypothetical protein